MRHATAAEMMAMVAAALLLVGVCTVSTAAPVLHGPSERTARENHPSQQCSGHGAKYATEEGALGNTGCQCYQCYEGPSCETLTENCALETRVAEATLFTPWFEARAENLTTTITPHYHPGYMRSPRVFPPESMPNDPSFDAISRTLNASIRALHRRVGNVAADQHTLVLGAGGVQLIDAALYALTQGPNSNKSMRVFAQAPYYPHFHMASSLNPLTNWTERGEEHCRKDAASLIEVVTSPNNPDGRQLSSVCPKAFQITDYVYRWPHYAAADITPRSDDIMIFSFSKLTGYAASRIGWAFVRDPEVAATMSNYMWLQSTAPAVEAQLRAAKVLQSLLHSMHGATPATNFFLYGRQVLAQRWQRLRALFHNQDRFTLKGQGGVLFMWIKCEHKADADNCARPFAHVGITTETGVNYGSGTDMVRICVGHHDSTFQLLAGRLQSLLHGNAAPPLAANQHSSRSQQEQEQEQERHGRQRQVHGPVEGAAFALKATQDSVSRSDVKRAATKTPRPTFRGNDFSDMSARLNGHLHKYAQHGVSFERCDTFSVDGLHGVTRQLHNARQNALQDIYMATNDSRRNAFGHVGRSLEDNIAAEADVATASDHAHALVRDALCHRLVMQFVHHLSETQRREGARGLTLPMLPDAYHHPDDTAQAMEELGGGSAPAAERDARETSGGHTSLVSTRLDAGAVKKMHEARRIYDKATKCIVCHIASNSTSAASTSANSDNAASTQDGQQQQQQQRGSEAGPRKPKPYVPLWPKEFDVRFGLTTAQGSNVSSHMYFSSKVPGMHIHHEQCVQEFLPQLPQVDGPCNLTFHSNGLWFMWPNKTTGVDNCCTVVLTDMTANLGLDELDGFEFVKNTTTTDYFGRKVQAEQWTNGPRLQPPKGFKIFIDRKTGEDVHYHNGGPYFLEWALDRRTVRPQAASTFELPANPQCGDWCSADLAAHAHALAHPVRAAARHLAAPTEERGA